MSGNDEYNAFVDADNSMIDTLETMAGLMNQMVDEMDNISPSCEMGKVSNFECDKMPEYELQLQQNDGITLTIIVCENCMKVLHNHANR